MDTQFHPSSKYFKTKEDYLAFRQHWKGVLKVGARPEACHFLVYSILIGHDWRKAFSLPTNFNKLNNGYTPRVCAAARQIILAVRHDSEASTALFGLILGDTVTAEMLQKVSEEVVTLARISGDRYGMVELRKIYSATMPKAEA